MAFVRTRAGFLTAMHDVLPRDDQGRLVARMLNPGSNMNQESSLRLVNTGTNSERVSIRGVDDGGRSAGPVTLALPAGQARTISAFDLENGARGLTGRLGDGAGKWRLLVTAGQSVVGLSLLETAIGPITNISTAGVPAMALTSPPQPLGDDHGNDIASATNLALGGRQSGRIDPAGDRDYFRIQVAESGTLTVYTTSDMDTEGRLFDGSGRRLASNSDGGAVFNFRIEREVDAGAYYAEVTEWRDDDTGSYTIHAEFDASTDPEPPSGGSYSGALSIADGNAWGWGVAADRATQTQADSVANAACEERKVGGSAACSVRGRFGSGLCVVLYVASDPITRDVIGWNASIGPRTSLDALQTHVLSNCQARRGGPTCTRLASRCNSGSASGFAPQTSLTFEGGVMIRENRKR